MRSGLRIGKVFGIEIEIDWSWFFIFLLISWNWATALGSLHNQWSILLRWTVAIVASLLFFLAVLAHEMAHSLVATSRGLPVTSIRLLLFGGVSNIQEEPKSAGTEFVMAIVGPLTSLVIGVVLLLVTGLATGTMGLASISIQQTLSNMSPTLTVIAWLGSVNIILGIFNLIPGFPLDGGRVLRSILWAITNNLKLATQWASAVGQGISWLMIIGGIAAAFGVPVPFIGAGLINGLWLAFIGWFLHSSAVQSYQQMVVHQALDDVPVSSVMRRDPPTVSSDRTVAEFVHDFIMQSDDHGFPVMDHGELIGIATLEDVRKVPRDEWGNTYVREIMTPATQLVTLAPEDKTGKALDILASRDIRQIPVVKDGRLEGLLRRTDIVKWMQLQTNRRDARGETPA